MIPGVHHLHAGSGATDRPIRLRSTHYTKFVVTQIFDQNAGACPITGL